MLRRLALPASCLLMLTCGGCYPNRAVIDPWSYAPSSSACPWIPPKSVKAMELSDEGPDLPGQNDPYSLGELIDIALRNNEKTKITWAQARSAAASYGQSQSEFFPAFDGTFTYQRARQPSFSTPGNLTSTTNNSPVATSTESALTVSDQYYTFWSPQLSITYLIYDFGTLRATSEAARQALYNADWTHNDAILTLLQTIMNDFYNYLYEQQLLIADVADVETARLTLDAAETGFNTGVRDISDVLQAKTQLLQNQTTWSGQQQNVETAYTTMLNDMGLPATMKLKTMGMPSELPTNDIVPPVETLIAVALQNRPDLLAAEANLRSKQETLRAAKTQFLPQFNYTFDIGKNYYGFEGAYYHDRYNFTNQVTVSMPLFQGFYYRNAIKIAQANKKAAEEQVKQTELSMIQQITSYHYNVRCAYDTLQFATAYLEAAKEQYVVALAQYKQGTNTILDVVSAQSALANARASQASAFQDWFTSLANLAYATGILSPNSLAPFGYEEEIHIANSDENEKTQKIHQNDEAAEDEED
jgi:outer membrane protein